MTVSWLLDATVFEAYHDELADAIVRNGHKVKSVNSPKAPFDWDDTGNSYLNAFPKGACVVTHADLDLVCRVLANSRWKPGAFATLANFHCSHYFAHFGNYILNEDYAMLPFAELQRRSDFLFRTFSRDDSIFVRPDSPLKLFTGMLASRVDFERDLEFMGFYEFPVESLVVVSSPKAILREWRFVIVDQSIVTSSHYKEQGEFLAAAGRDEGASAFALAVLAKGWSPDPVWVMDICQTSDQHYHLLEIGAFSFANLYGCDKDAVVQAVSRVAERVAAEQTP